jgi:hypothetical protein
MRLKKIFWGLLKSALLLLGFMVLFLSALMWNIQNPLEKHKIKPGSLWTLAVDKELRQMPTPLGAQLQSYDTKGDGLHLDGYDLARYTWENTPVELQVWVDYWKQLGYVQVADAPEFWQPCKGSFAFLRKSDLISSIEICHEPDTKTTWIKKSP